jgi:hypothetical protein
MKPLPPLVAILLLDWIRTVIDGEERAPHVQFSFLVASVAKPLASHQRHPDETTGW